MKADDYTGEPNLAHVIPIREELTRRVMNEMYRTEPLGENARIVKRDCAHEFVTVDICKHCGIGTEVH